VLEACRPARPCEGRPEGRAGRTEQHDVAGPTPIPRL
jgi:hypothetical protein